MRIVVTGRNGQLATALVEQASDKPNLEMFMLGRPSFDLDFPTAAVDQIRTLRPDIVINTAAYTAVDKAEVEPERAFAINRDGAALVAHAASQTKASLVHISTNYVFDGNKLDPYMEQDEPRPLNVYGRSKLEGEYAVLNEHPEALILRTSWIFSAFGSNFLKTMLGLGAERPVIRVVNDQTGNPTSASDLATAILDIVPALRGELGGVYHLAGGGSTNWHDFAAFIIQESMKHGGPSPLLEAVSSAEYMTAAARPANSRLDCTAFAKRFGVTLRPWYDATAETVARCLSP